MTNKSTSTVRRTSLTGRPCSAFESHAWKHDICANCKRSKHQHSGTDPPAANTHDPTPAEQAARGAVKDPRAERKDSQQNSTTTEKRSSFARNKDEEKTVVARASAKPSRKKQDEVNSSCLSGKQENSNKTRDCGVTDGRRKRPSQKSAIDTRAPAALSAVDAPGRPSLF